MEGKPYVGDKEYDGSLLLAPESKTNLCCLNKKEKKSESQSRPSSVWLSHSVSPSQARTDQGDETSLDEW